MRKSVNIHTTQTPYDTVNSGGDAPAAREFLDKTMDVFLHQNVHEATRIRHGQNPSKLDYIFTEEDNLIDNLEILPLLGKSDHACLQFKYLFGNADSYTDSVKGNFWKADYAAINIELSSIDWRAELQTKNVTETWITLRDKVNALCEQHVPIKKTIANFKKCLDE